MPGSSSKSRCKLFVGGLSWDTNEASLVAYFEKFGKVVDAVVMRNRDTGQPRGFGFVTFENDEVARKVASMGRHELDGRLVETKVAVPRFVEETDPSTPASIARTERLPDSDESCGRRVFVGGLPRTCTEEELMTYFSQYGAVEEVRIMVDYYSGVPRGFGFVVFADSSVAQRVLSLDPETHSINGSLIQVKAANSRRNEPAKNRESRSNPWGLLPRALVGTQHSGIDESYGFDAFGVDYAVVAQYLHAIYGGSIESWESWARKVRAANRPPNVSV